MNSQQKVEEKKNQQKLYEIRNISTKMWMHTFRIVWCPILWIFKFSFVEYLALYQSYLNGIVSIGHNFAGRISLRNYVHLAFGYNFAGILNPIPPNRKRTQQNCVQKSNELNILMALLLMALLVNECSICGFSNFWPLESHRLGKIFSSEATEQLTIPLIQNLLRNSVRRNVDWPPLL